MKAPDVYTIAQALSDREQVKLYDMLRESILKKQSPAKKNRKVADFSVEDAIRFLLNNHIK